MNSNRCVQEYINQLHLYEKYAERLAGLIKNLLNNEGIQYQQVTFRAKSPQNLNQKILKKKKRGIIYQSLDDITDLAGVRIILYFKDDIEKVVHLLVNNFKIHNQHNVCLSQKITQNPNEFRYASEHRIISLDGKNNNIWHDYEKLQTLKCEIQIRTVLQHAWAEIEHGIGYKPTRKTLENKRIELTRMFAQNSALLEVADDNFVKIRNEFN